MSSATGFCFGVPTVVLVLDDVSDSRQANQERRRIERLTSASWQRFADAVETYVAIDVVEQISRYADAIFNTYDTVYSPENTLLIPNDEIQAAYESAQLETVEVLASLEALLVAHFEPEKWNAVAFTWRDLDARVEIRRLGIDNLAWFIPEEQGHLEWPIIMVMRV